MFILYTLISFLTWSTDQQTDKIYEIEAYRSEEHSQEESDIYLT